MMSHTHTQSGVALIIFLTILILGITAILLSELNTRHDLMLEDQAQTRRALIQAKEALIGYAASYYDYDEQQGMYGFLPCPDLRINVIPEGEEDGSCGSTDKSSLGRLPWKKIGLLSLRDGAKECLWYAVSGPYKQSPRTSMLNEDTNGLFNVSVSDGTDTLQLTGTQPQDRAVAVIIAPGKILSNQNRTPVNKGKGVEICGGKYEPTAYLETDVNNLVDDDFEGFLTAQDIVAQNSDNSNPINDRVVYITREELWGAIRKRLDFMRKMQYLTRSAASCVANYANSLTDRRLPWAAPVALADYGDNAEYKAQESVLSGRLPNDIKNSSGSNDFLITNCDSTIMTPEFLTLWQNWKDHLFYAVANAHQPNASTSTPVCDNSDILSENDCLQVNNNNYAAVVMFSNGPLPVVGSPAKEQLRDNKGDITNYLEGLNAVVNTDGKGIYQQWNLSDDINNPDNINDILYCIRDNDLAVMLCPCTPAMKAIHSWCP